MMNKTEYQANEDQWNAVFKEGGRWEKAYGRRQTRLFAEAFCKHTQIDLESGQTILDSSCALGDAIPALASQFPNAKLHGCDLSSVAIARCKKEQGDQASFFVGAMEEITGTYDMIYSSNTLEHLVDYQEKVRELLKHCRYLCILVPYDEQRFGRDLEYDLEADHVVTFRENSFNFLLEEGSAKHVHPPRVISIPTAWSWSLLNWIIQPLKNILRPFFGRPMVRNQKQILYEIKSAE